MVATPAFVDRRRAARAVTARRCALAVLLCLPALLPLLVIAHAALSPEDGGLGASARYVLPEVIAQHVALVIGVALVSGVLGTVLAWLTAMCEFPGRRFFDWALLLPLAIPAYVLAFVAVGFLDYAGPLQSWLRDAFGTSRVVSADPFERRRHRSCCR